MTITNLNLTKVGFIRKFWPKRFHQIDSRSSKPSKTVGSKKSKRPKVEIEYELETETRVRPKQKVGHWWPTRTFVICHYFFQFAEYIFSRPTWFLFLVGFEKIGIFNLLFRIVHFSLFLIFYAFSNCASYWTASYWTASCWIGRQDD
jgi:hypothetical protein